MPKRKKNDRILPLHMYALSNEFIIKTAIFK